MFNQFFLTIKNFKIKARVLKNILSRIKVYIYTSLYKYKII